MVQPTEHPTGHISPLCLPTSANPGKRDSKDLSEKVSSLLAIIKTPNSKELKQSTSLTSALPESLKQTSSKTTQVASFKGPLLKDSDQKLIRDATALLKYIAENSKHFERNQSNSEALALRASNLLRESPQGVSQLEDQKRIKELKLIENLFSLEPLKSDGKTSKYDVLLSKISSCCHSELAFLGVSDDMIQTWTGKLPNRVENKNKSKAELEIERRSAEMSFLLNTVTYLLKEELETFLDPNRLVFAGEGKDFLPSSLKELTNTQEEGSSTYIWDRWDLQKTKEAFPGKLIGYITNAIPLEDINVWRETAKPYCIINVDEKAQKIIIGRQAIENVQELVEQFTKLEPSKLVTSMELCLTSLLKMQAKRQAAANKMFSEKALISKVLSKSDVISQIVKNELLEWKNSKGIFQILQNASEEFQLRQQKQQDESDRSSVKQVLDGMLELLEPTRPFELDSFLEELISQDGNSDSFSLDSSPFPELSAADRSNPIPIEQLSLELSGKKRALSSNGERSEESFEKTPRNDSTAKNNDVESFDSFSQLDL